MKDDRNVPIEKIMAKNAFLYKILILNADSVLSDVFNYRVRKESYVDP